jgi:hypothetical protein
MITNELKALVIDEATKLREHATTEERGRLDFATMIPHHVGYCIYGQMTGSCYSSRANDLLDLCTHPYAHNPLHDDNLGENYCFGDGDSRAFSPIEAYIVRPGAENETLIAYLRGERETLTPEDL